MKPGTPGFVGSRLREAREGRGLNTVSLADLIGVTRAAISQYENGHQSPAPEVMRRITTVLNFPLHFFLHREPEEEAGTRFYRSMSTATKQARIRAERRYGWFRDIVAYLSRFVKFPVLKFPQFDFPDKPSDISESEIEKSASETRRFWGLGDGPISNVTWLLENNGAVIGRYDLCADKLDAFSEWRPKANTPYVILGADKGSAARSRYDAGHELGHMIIHRKVDNRLINKSEVFNLIEGQAHRFAGAFLLPQSTFAEDIRLPVTLDSLYSLKTKWRVSIALMIMRASQLGMIPKEESRRLWINRTRRGWRYEEPLDDSLEPETPRFVRRSIEMLIDRGIVSRQDLMYQIRLPAKDIEELAGLKTNYLSEQDDLPLELRNILPFPKAQ